MRYLNLIFWLLGHALADSVETSSISSSSASSNTEITSTVKSSTDNDLKSSISRGTDSSSASSTSSSSNNQIDGSLKIDFLVRNNRTKSIDTEIYVSDNIIGIGLDLVQPEIWVMGGHDIEDCSAILEWWASEESLYGTSALPGSLTTENAYTATMCALEGFISHTISDESSPTRAGVQNGESYTIPYVNTLNAHGKFRTGNVRFDIGDSIINLTDYTYVEVQSANGYVGGLGIAGSKSGISFLDSLVTNNYIKSPGYSLAMSNISEGTSDPSMARLMLGYVEEDYLDGEFLSFPLPEVEFVGYEDDDLSKAQDLILPILPLYDVIVVNDNTNEVISLTNNISYIPVLLDTKSDFAALPLDVIVNFAIQTNAYYSSEIESWVVDCEAIKNVNASLRFVFGNLTVEIPLEELVADYWGLNFSNGERACILRMMPDTIVGYCSLGIPFLKHIYLAFDAAGQTIGIGNVNADIEIENPSSNTVFNQSTYSMRSSSTQSRKGNNSQANTTVEATNISSGFIPFATQFSQDDYTMTFTKFNASTNPAISVPSRFSGLIKSGEIYISFRTSVSTGLFPALASAATTTKSKSSGSQNTFVPTNLHFSNSIAFMFTALGLFVILLVL